MLSIHAVLGAFFGKQFSVSLEGFSAGGPGSGSPLICCDLQQSLSLLAK